jgi:hypothetical protein
MHKTSNRKERYIGVGNIRANLKDTVCEVTELIRIAQQ